MAQKKLSLTQKKMLEHFLSLLPEDEETHLDLPTLVRLIRKRLHMTQKNLADRIGVPQSFISKVESGQVEPTLKTLKKIFNGFFCDFVILPVPKCSFDELLEKQAERAALKHVEYVKGTMSLEKQLPDEEFIKELVKEEKDRYLYTGSSKIWEA